MFPDKPRKHHPQQTQPEPASGLLRRAREGWAEQDKLTVERKRRDMNLEESPGKPSRQADRVLVTEKVQG